MGLLALVLLGLVLLFFQGSLEEFPTDEQHEKMRVVLGIGIAILLLAGGILFLVYRKVRG
jgi:hypothetical protein